LNLPNRLTVARIASIPLILVFMLPIPVGGELFSRWNAFILHYGMMAALFLFIIASITDFLDGRIARNMGIVTNTGKLMDPIADKLLVISVLVALTQLGRLSAIIVIIILAREFLITGVRMLAASRGQVVAADRSGKIKTVFQMTAIILLLLQISFARLYAFQYTAPWMAAIESVLHVAADVFVVLALAATVLSGIRYIRSGMAFLRD
jgi:CDP-diacylglycerol--glycerol-3-phosphate 3-phosphatidyltransferase